MRPGGKFLVHLQVDVQCRAEELAASILIRGRLDQWVTDIVKRRTHTAMGTLNFDPVNDDTKEAYAKAQQDTASEKQLGQSPKKQGQSILSGTALRDILLRDFGKDASGLEDSQHKAVESDQPTGMFSRNDLIMSWCRRQLRKSGPVIEVEGDPSVPLNRSQRRAIALMLSKRISLVQGPPGTGKTRTLIEAINLLKSHWQVPDVILVTGFTNTSVDNIADGLSKKGLKVLRYGDAVKVRDDLRHTTLDYHIEHHPLHPQFKELVQKIAKAKAESKAEPGEIAIEIGLICCTVG